MKKALSSITVLLLLSAVILLYSQPASAANNDGNNEGEYYFAFGDSITAGKQIDDCDGFDYSLVYISQMKARHDAVNSVDHIDDTGAGMRSDEGIENFSTWYDSGNDWFVFMFGNNDCATYEGGLENWANAEAYAKNMMTIYNWSIENGSKTMLCCMPGYKYDVSRWHSQPGNYMPYMNESMEIWLDNCIKFFPTWDAIDDIPLDGRFQQIDVDNYNCSSRSHLNFDGHKAIGELMWIFINGWDYNTTYYSGNNTLLVATDYNETIFINNTKYTWDTDDLRILCLNNDTEVGFTLQTAFNGSQMIRFDIQKGSEYILADNILEFISIEGGVNGSTILNSNPTINWTVITNASQYHLEIDNNNVFSSPEINYTNINEYNYPVNCDINATRVSFTLPDSLPSYDTYYMRVRAYRRQ